MSGNLADTPHIKRKIKHLNSHSGPESIPSNLPDYKIIVIVRDTQKMNACRVWLLTYGASGPNITADLCDKYGQMEVDECYTLIKRDLKYTLIHSVKRFRIHAINELMKKLHESHRIVSNSVFGYDAISSNTLHSKTADHPGIKLMIESMNAKDPSFQYWMASGDIYTNKKGLLFQYIPKQDVNLLTRPQLIHMIIEQREALKKMEADLKEKNDAYVALEIDMDQCKQALKRKKEEYASLELEMDQCEEANKKMRKRLKLYRFICNPDTE